ncbi:hypothetical protein ACSFCT_03955 [Yokenella regensburgei]|uniref:hypothetical protein n=1 Tax=Yokenella regensburgei TaxID=158877 RepID=UPI003ED9F8ED
MAIKSKLLVGVVVLALLGASHYVSYLKGWYAHSEKVNREAAAKNKRAEIAVASGEKKAAAANAESKVIYRTIYRDVVKYVNDPDHTKCDFDERAVQLRQRAIDAANHIPGFDEPAVQSK